MISIKLLFDSIENDNIDTKKYIHELMDWFENNVKYGFIYNGKKVLEDDPNLQELLMKYYYLSQPNEFEKIKIGTCFDQSLYIYYKLNQHNIDADMYFIQQHQLGYVHLFTVFNYDNNFYRFETSLDNYKFAGPFNNISDIINDTYKDIENMYHIGKGFSFNKVNPNKLLNKKLSYKEVLFTCGFDPQKYSDYYKTHSF